MYYMQNFYDFLINLLSDTVMYHCEYGFVNHVRF